ncbi:hypothetical protein Syun_003987 [Stephania yunnanensis]|uniref:Uncharacterized protein n=1 Tax=Stephania yunnanensis TaxID=152371 RepID=A0AAP0L355_9MAGN
MKKNELVRGAGASKTYCDLKEGATDNQLSDLPDQQLAIRMSQANSLEPSSSDATESDRGEGREEEIDENRDSDGEDGEGREGDKKGSRSGCGSDSGSRSASGSQDGSTEEEEEGSASGGNYEEGEGEKGEDFEEEVVEVRSSAKALRKAKKIAGILGLSKDEPHVANDEDDEIVVVDHEKDHHGQQEHQRQEDQRGEFEKLRRQSRIGFNVKATVVIDRGTVLTPSLLNDGGVQVFSFSRLVSSWVCLVFEFC